MIGEAVAKGRKIHFLPPYRFDHYLWLEALTGIRAAAVQNYTSVELIKAVVALRASKEPCEIEELDKAAHVGYLMHTTAMKMCRPGVKKQLIAAL